MAWEQQKWSRPTDIIYARRLLVDFSVALWYSLLPIFDDVTDAMLLLATFEGRGGLWLACFGAFVLTDFEGVLLFLVTLLPVYWVLFALLATNEFRVKRFEVALKALNGWHDLRLEPIVVRSYVDGDIVWGNRPSALR